MFRILVINTLYSPYIGGGAEIICQEQAESFAGRGHHVAVLTTGRKGAGLVADVVNGLTVYRAGIKNVYWHYTPKHSKIHHLLWHMNDIYNRRMSAYVYDVINRENPDVIICHNLAGFSVSAWAAVKRHGLPLIEVLHDQYLRCPNSNAFKNGKPCLRQCMLCRLMRLPHRGMTQKVDAVVGVSRFVLGSLTSLGYFKNSRQYVLHNARRFDCQPKRCSWNGARPLCIGYIGTLSEVKGVEWLIRSFMQLDINAELIIAGKGITEAFEEHLHSLSATDSRIHFSGYTTPVAHYPQIDLSVIPSLWPDTFPTVAFESCAYGVPVVATNRGGLPEIIHHGVNGLVCDADRKESLTEAIRQLYDSPETLAQMSAACPNSVHEMTDVDLWTDCMVNIIKDITNK